ncbi:hypothetical protein RB195_000738 [Necator americanus]|uniref:Glycosyltransferase family 92 protein n=1 Tax=Necator americanus TaxID=51031 RepID=A0ABR1DC06_NECAM
MLGSFHGKAARYVCGSQSRTSSSTTTRNRFPKLPSTEAPLLLSILRFSCVQHLRAEYMTVSEEKEQAITVAARIIDRISAKPQYTLSLCLAALYGNQSKWLLLAELVEHYKLQGVEHFYFYIKDIDQYSQKLVNDYVENGEAEVVYFRQEEDRLPEDWQHVSVQDCLQRSRHHSRYSIFGDLDERIIPLGKIRLVDYVLKKMGEKNNIGMIKFTPRFVLRTRKPPDNYEGTKTLSKNLPTLVFRNTSATPLGYYTKCILDPTRVLLQWVHNVKVYFPGYVGLEAPRNEVIIRILGQAVTPKGYLLNLYSTMLSPLDDAFERICNKSSGSTYSDDGDDAETSAVIKGVNDLDFTFITEHLSTPSQWLVKRLG